MRIVAGRWRGRRLKAPGGLQVRPTADRVREAWMSIIQPQLPGAVVLDLFAGSGALGLEALSRGAARVDFVEIAPASLRAIRENIASLEAGEETRVHRADALRFVSKLRDGEYDIVLADPPYGHGTAARLAQRWLRDPFSSLLSIEHRRDEKLPGQPELRRYGDTVIAFYDEAGLRDAMDRDAAPLDGVGDTGQPHFDD